MRSPRPMDSADRDPEPALQSTRARRYHACGMDISFEKWLPFTSVTAHLTVLQTSGTKLGGACRSGQLEKVRRRRFRAAEARDNTRCG